MTPETKCSALMTIMWGSLPVQYEVNKPYILGTIILDKRGHRFKRVLPDYIGAYEDAYIKNQWWFPL